MFQHHTGHDDQTPIIADHLEQSENDCTANGSIEDEQTAAAVTIVATVAVTIGAL
ncbi:hypothetical protein [Nocardia sp. NPDC051570]|uniref:hypothetical protein n=1 Tax=Nocardia sp. NPDC051570 TaxID=3364324 RepID=UPI0037AEC03D